MPGAGVLCRIYTDCEMPEPELIEIAGGGVALFTSRSPERGGPNQDGAAVVGLDPSRAVLAVADGVGGQPGGASASAVTLKELERAVASLGSEASIRSGILDGFEAANHAVLDLGIGAATTLAVAEIDAHRVRAYHVGDSGIVVTGQRGRIKLQTMAHSPVGYAIEAGVLDEDEALHHEERHVVSNLVGSADMRIEVGSSLALADRDSLLLATDGLFDNLSLAEIVEIVRAGPLGAAAGELAARSRARMQSGAGEAPSKPDDVTFALYRRGSVR